MNNIIKNYCCTGHDYDIIHVDPDIHIIGRCQNPDCRQGKPRDKREEQDLIDFPWLSAWHGVSVDDPESFEDKMLDLMESEQMRVSNILGIKRNHE